MRLTLAPITLKCLIFLTIMAVTTGFLYAGGAKEDQMTVAKQYFAEKKYDAAMNTLMEIIKNDPERMDEANQMVRAILAARNNFTDIGQQLVDVLTNDPGNYNKALDLIKQMEAKYPNPSIKIKKDLEGFRITANLNKIRFDKNKIMEAALAQIAALDYVGAIDTYLSGFPLAENDFKLGTQTEEFRKAILDRTALVSQAVTNLKTQNNLLIPSLQSFLTDIKAGKDGIDRLNTRFPAFAAQLIQTVGQTVTLEQAADSMTELRQRSDKEYPSSDPNYNYNEYIRIIQEFMQGPPGKTGQGVRFAARTLIDNEYRDTLVGLEELYAARKKELEILALNPGDADLVEPGRLVQVSGLILLRAQGLQASVDLGTSPSFADISAKLPELYRKAPAIVLGELRSYQQLQADVRLAATLKRLKASKASTVFQEAISAWDTASTDLAGWEKDIKVGTSSGLVDQNQYNHFKSLFSNYHDQNQTGLLTLARESYSTIAQSQLAQIRNLYTLAGVDEKKGNDLLNGVTAAGQTIARRYPDQALAQYNAVKTKYLAHLGSLDILDKDMGGVRKEIGSFKTVQNTIDASAQLRKEINAAIARLDGSVALSQANIKAAQDNIQKAVQAVGLADAAIAGSRPDLDAADRNYDQANQFYFKAFDIAYNADQNSLADNRLRDLKDRIETARNNEFNRQIRELLTTTQAQFLKEEYQAALGNIAKATELDNQTAAYKNAIQGGVKPEDARNPEISYWKNRIQAASTLSTERGISESDPNFNALANYLNMAQIDYNRLSTQLDAGNKADAILVARTKQNIDNVLLVKPNNWDAKLLKLRVEQVVDPKAFPPLLANRINDAVKRAVKEKSPAALTDMLALLEFDKANKTLTQAIFDLRVALGLIDSPLTTQKKNDAANLVVQARQLSTSKNQADLQRAVTALNSAFKLNPQNADIGGLLDLVRSKLKSIEAVLTIDEQQKLNEAQNQYTNGQYVQALTTVRNLLVNHPNDARLIKLLGQINQGLGQ